MPQFELEHFIPQLAWLALFFAILYFGIVRFTLPKVGRVITAREDAIGSDISTAERAKREADEIRTAYEASVAKVHADAQAAIAEAKANAARAVEGKLAGAQTGLDVRLDQAAADLAQARSRAVAEIERIAGEAARDIVARLTGSEPSEAEVAKALAAQPGA